MTPEPVDCLVITTTVRFSWLDRLRVLFGRAASVQVWIDWPTVVPEHGPIRSVTTVDRVFPVRSLGAGYSPGTPNER